MIIKDSLSAIALFPVESNTFHRVFLLHILQHISKYVKCTQNFREGMSHPSNIAFPVQNSRHFAMSSLTGDLILTRQMLQDN